jgi:hypothetical protein
MTKPNWLVKWMRAPFFLNFYPCMTGIAGYLLLLILPENVLTLHPPFKLFTDFMSNLVPGIPVFANNMPQESVLLVYALLWAQLPFWIKLYSQPVTFSLTEVKIEENLKRAGREKDILWVALFTPALILLALWGIWSGYPFTSGEPLFARGLMFTNKLTVAFWMYLNSGSSLIFAILVPATLSSWSSAFKLLFRKK